MAEKKKFIWNFFLYSFFVFFSPDIIFIHYFFLLEVIETGCNGTCQRTGLSKHPCLLVQVSIFVNSHLKITSYLSWLQELKETSKLPMDFPISHWWRLHPFANSKPELCHLQQKGIIDKYDSGWSKAAELVRFLEMHEENPVAMAFTNAY